MQIHADKLYAILISLLFLIQALLIKKRTGTFIFPATLMSLAWFAFSIFPLVLLLDTEVNPIAIAYIFICVLLFSLPSLFFDWKKAFEINAQKPIAEKNNFNSSYMKTIFIACIFYAIFFSTLVLVSSGYQYGDIFTDLRYVSASFASKRSEGLIVYNIYGILSIFFTYLTPVIGGLAFYKHPNFLIKVSAFVFSFVPALFFMITQSSKLAIFYAVGFYIAAHMLRKIQNGHLALIEFKTFLTIFLSMLAVSPFLIFAFISRTNISDPQELYEFLLKMIQSYTLAQLYAFSDFFSHLTNYKLASQNTYVHDLNSYGAYSFTSIYNFFMPDKNFPPGTYIDVYKNKELTTNIFTLFRGLINDFGLYGTMIYMFISGFIAHLIFHRLLTKSAHFANSAFIILVAYIEGSYLASIFMARYIYLLFLGLAVLFYINQYISYREKS